jgi:uncharacterized membrane protein
MNEYEKLRQIYSFRTRTIQEFDSHSFRKFGMNLVAAVAHITNTTCRHTKAFSSLIEMMKQIISVFHILVILLLLSFSTFRRLPSFSSHLLFISSHLISLLAIPDIYRLRLKLKHFEKIHYQTRMSESMRRDRVKGNYYINHICVVNFFPFQVEHESCT